MSLFCHCWNSFGISIHALLAESDFQLDVMITTFYYFYPRSPCGERLKHLENRAQDLAFLSTLSLRRATRTWKMRLSVIADFYPRSPCGERHCNFSQKRHPLTISIHALLAESDFIFSLPLVLISLFLSTLSLRRATHQE